MHNMITRVQIFGLPSPDKRIQTEKNIPLLTVHFSSRQVSRILNRGWLCKTVYTGRKGHEEFSCHFIQKSLDFDEGVEQVLH